MRVRRGLYATVLLGVSPDSVQVDPYLLATKVADDATVSHHAALQFHGRAYSVWSQVTFFTRRNSRPFHFGETGFVPVKPASSVAEFPDMGGGVEFVAAHGVDYRAGRFLPRGASRRAVRRRSTPRGA